MPDRPPTAATLGFLTVVQDPAGWVGGYLVTNAWGRPLEFRLTSAVQPNRVQTALYGPTLAEYLHADVIGKALVEKTGVRPDLIVTDAAAALGLGARVGLPLVVVWPDADVTPADARPFSHPRSAAGLLLPAGGDEAAIRAILDAIDPAVELGEPFARVREAVAEARKGGVTRAA